MQSNPMYNIRLLTDSDYDILCSWWKWHRFPIIPKEYLPENGCGGIMVTVNDINVCAGFIYFTNSKICWIEYVVSNPEYRNPDRSEVIQFLIYELTGIAQRKGFKAAFTSIKKESLVSHYQQCGYTKGKNNTTEMIINL